MYFHKFVNTETGEETIVEMSKSEIKVIEANIAKRDADLEEVKAKAEAKAAILARLGLNEEEAALLLG